MIFRQRCRRARQSVVGATLLAGSSMATGVAADAASSGATAAGFGLTWKTNASLAQTDPQRIFVEVDGIPAPALDALRSRRPEDAAWSDLLSVHAESGDLISAVTLPPMLGAFRVLDRALRFEPRFPLESGITYRAVLHPEKLPGSTTKGTGIVSTTWRKERIQSVPSTVVSAVYPTAAALPENLLKFYLHFSAPMSRGQAYEHVRLLDVETGRPLDLPFLELTEELWDPGMTRLTLFIDPGRIKRGLRPIEEVGPALETGRRYTLVIDAAWLDATGTPLKQEHRKSFEVRQPDRITPEPGRWKITAPEAGTRGALTVQFDEPLDHALARRCIHVEGVDGRLVSGSVSLNDGERRWTMEPDAPWQAGAHRVRIETRIEDLAGNNIGKAYDVALADGTTTPVNREQVERSFVVR